MKKNLVLLGMMGVGKSTVGKIVAERQGLEFIDIDINIEKKFRMKIAEIFEKKGEDFFRNEEKKEVLKSLKKSNCVIALGGGAFMNEVVRKIILKDEISIWLDININTLNERTKSNKKRPLLNEKDNKKKIEELYNKRKNIYELASHKINCDNLDKESITEKILDFYEK